MGLIKVTTKISNFPKTHVPYEADFLVDTGEIDCMASGSQLKAAGIQVEGKDVYELANGEPVEYRYGFARVEFMGEETVSKVIFGPEDIEPILGVVALESVGILVDPVSIEPQRSEGSAIIRRIRRPYKLVVAWMALHEDELAADWEFISAGEPFFRIKPLD